MNDGFIYSLFSPMILLFLINSFFLVYVTSLAWNIFEKQKDTRELYALPGMPKHLLKVILLLPVLLLAIIIECSVASLQQMNFFPLLNSSFVKLNLIGIIIALTCLTYINHLNKKIEHKKSSMAIFLSTYSAVIYILYLTVVIATVVTRLNIFPDGLLNGYAAHQAERINQCILSALFLIYLLFVSVVVGLNTRKRMIIFFMYTLFIAFANHTLQR